MSDPFLAECRDQDRALRAHGLRIWVGAEPTFTRPDSSEACWLVAAEGGDKDEKARALLSALAARLPADAEVCRAEGRLYPDEDQPRFAYGARWRRGPGGSDEGDEARAGPPSAASALSALGSPATPCLAPPPPDPEVAWLTVTPDPGVVEVNMAPEPSLAGFLRQGRMVHQAAAEVGLSAVRLRWNGELSDSGGGGQLTLGGPTPLLSPFFVHPHLLPGLLRYCHLHPSLSYWFGMECLGSAGQGPRPDEGDGERFDELVVALDRCRRGGGPRTPEALWALFSPLLVDGSGNSHRAEINIEKLWNHHLPGRGLLGLVELRALRMEPSAERMAAVAALFRAVAARLCLAPFSPPLGRLPRLHDELALPDRLADDLRAVLDDLAVHQLAPGPAITAELLRAPAPLARLEAGELSLEVRPAIEFWPLVGDVASQERRTARLVDSSSGRLQVKVLAPAGAAAGEVVVEGVRLPLGPAGSEGGRDRHLAAVRYRRFAPHPGFHPDVPPHDPLRLEWRIAGGCRAVALYGWRPQGGAYPALPASADEARARCAERVVPGPAAGFGWGAALDPHAPAPGADDAGAVGAGELTLDLRRFPPGGSP